MASSETWGQRRARLLWSATAGGLVGLVAVALWVWLGPSVRPVPSATSALPQSALAGKPAPEFTLKELAGETFALRTLRGRPVVLNFWASWCTPCREETPLLVRLHQTYGPRGVAFVGVDEEDEPAAARSFAARYHVDYPAVIAPDDRLLRAYAIVGLPTTVFIGPDGIVRGTEVGGFIGPDGERSLVAALDRLLQAPR